MDAARIGQKAYAHEAAVGRFEWLYLLSYLSSAIQAITALSFPKIQSKLKLLHLQVSVDSLRGMNAVLTSLLSTLFVTFRSRLALQAEILALRHQLNVLQRSTGTRRRLRLPDRILRVWLSRLWSGWRSAVGLEPQQLWVEAHCRLAKLPAARGDGQGAKELVTGMLQLWKDADLDLPLLKEALQLQSKIARS